MLSDKQRIAKAAVAVMAAAAFLWAYTQIVDATGTMPRCLFKWATGWSCPGCGSQRAFMALLHGHPIEAMRQNLLIAPATAYLAILAAGYLFRNSTCIQRLYKALTSPLALIYVAITIVSWMVVRNLLGI